jgi:hypothetical protein
MSIDRSGKLLLALASTLILSSEFHGTRNDILLPHDSGSCRLKRNIPVNSLSISCFLSRTEQRIHRNMTFIVKCCQHVRYTKLLQRCGGVALYPLDTVRILIPFPFFNFVSTLEFPLIFMITYCVKKVSLWMRWSHIYLSISRSSYMPCSYITFTTYSKRFLWVSTLYKVNFDLETPRFLPNSIFISLCRHCQTCVLSVSIAMP